jgi:hypothetical protein
MRPSEVSPPSAAPASDAQSANSAHSIPLKYVQLQGGSSDDASQASGAGRKGVESLQRRRLCWISAASVLLLVAMAGCGFLLWVQLRPGPGELRRLLCVPPSRHEQQPSARNG